MTSYSIAGADSLILLAPSLVVNLFLLRAGTQGYPKNERLHGSVDIFPEMAGIVYTYPYLTTDYVVSRSDQVLTVPMALATVDFLDAFTYAGMGVPLAPGFKAPTVSDQVWQLVRDGVLELRRVRTPRFFDGDGTPVDFVPLPVRPVLQAKVVGDTLVVGRNIDAGVAQKIRGYSLTPGAARLTKSEVVADANGVAVFPMVRAVGNPYAQFRFSIIDATHCDLLVDTAGFSTSAAPDPWVDNPPTPPPPPLPFAPDISQYVNSYSGPVIGQPWGPLQVQPLFPVDAELTVVIEVPPQYSTPSGQTITLVWASGEWWAQESETLTPEGPGDGVFTYTVSAPGYQPTTGTFSYPLEGLTGMLVGTPSGAYAYDGTDWTLHPSIPAMESCVTTDPTDGTIFVSQANALYVSTDGGQTFSESTPASPYAGPYRVFRAGGRAYAIKVGYDGGVYSDDLVNWASISLDSGTITDATMRDGRIYFAQQYPPANAKAYSYLEMSSGVVTYDNITYDIPDFTVTGGVPGKSKRYICGWGGGTWAAPHVYATTDDSNWTAFDPAFQIVGAGPNAWVNMRVANADRLFFMSSSDAGFKMSILDTSGVSDAPTPQVCILPQLYGLYGYSQAIPYWDSVRSKYVALFHRTAHVIESDDGVNWVQASDAPDVHYWHQGGMAPITPVSLPPT